MSDYHLAQLNIGKMLAPMDSPVMADFANNLDRINSLAEKSEGFVWRLKDEGSNDATAIQVFEDDFIIVNMSVWRSVDALFQFTYASDHVEIFKRKKEWFHKMTDMHMAFWYIEAGNYPSPEEAKERLNYLNTHGETPYAFTFKSKFTTADAQNYNLKT
jgi:hypothetical protein